MDQNMPEIDSIFCRAVEIETAGERAAYIQSVCGDDLEAKRRVERLLEAHCQAGNFMESPPAEVPRTIALPAVTEQPGAIIGRYKLLQQIGEGGFGVVFMAEQVEPVRRKVALKIIKPGMDTKEVIARFEAERQALALMDHPNIAKVLDAGSTESGRPYFVMELIRGIPITDYCDQANLATHERLDLFVAVCRAVQHAHQKGIVHRDIKPKNVLVTLHDGKPVVKVIDFGIAKATDHRLTERTLFTKFGQMIGTPMYMSPEQAELSGLDVDTRTDIYALGVLLYELLTGATPFDGKRLCEAAYDEVRRIIREEEPPAPSKKISTLGDALQAVSAHRQTDPRTLSTLVSGDLDWIVMKALEKDRSRRYTTTEAFAADIERHLSDQPVLARPPSPIYRLRKFLRRHRMAVGSASLITIAIVLAVVLGRFVGGKTGPDIQERTSLLEQAQQYQDNRQYAEAEAAYRKVLAWDRRVFGDQKPETLSTLRRLARLCDKEEHREEAVKTYEELLAGQSRTLGESDQETRQTVNELSRACWNLGFELSLSDTDVDGRAGKLVGRAVTLAGRQSASAFWARIPLALAQVRNRDAASALTSLEPALDLAWHPYPWFVMAMVLQQLGQNDAARDWYAVASDATNESRDENVRRLRAMAASTLVLPDPWPPANWRVRDSLDACTRLIAKYPRLSWMYHRRAAYYARLGLWSNAISDHAKAVELSPQEMVHRLNLGVLLLHSGDVQRYKEVCRNASPFIGNRESYNVARILLLCGLSPSSQADFRALKQTADQVFRGGYEQPWMQLARALNSYRCGQYQEALAIIPSDTGLPSRTLGRLVRAMAHQELGQSQAAQLDLKTARREIGQDLASYDGPGGSNDGTMYLCHATTWCVVQTVLREAESLIESGSKAAAK